MSQFLHSTNHEVFYMVLAVYGVLLGATHTPASYYLGDVVDNLEDTASKDAANGCWNTAWELGGSIGFLLAGIPDTTKWREEQQVILGCCGVLVMGAFGFTALSRYHKAL